MKRIFALTLITALLLCGCGKEKQSPVNDDVNAATDHAGIAADSPVNDNPGYVRQPMVAISVPIINETMLADDGTTICNYAYQNMYITVPDQQIADTVIIDFLNRQDADHAAAKAISDQAASNYSGQENWVPYSYKSLYSPTRLDHSVLSLYGESATYLGDSHPQIECNTINYNMVSGEVLTLGSILYNVDALETLCDLVIQNMAALKDTSLLYDEYPEIVRHRFSREESYDEDWFFTETGLSFFFSPYEVAPYVSGIVIVEIPYSELSGVIADEFFPPEEDLAEGTIYAQLLEDAKLEEITQIAEVPLHEQGQQIFLHCDGIVRDVVLEYGFWDESGTNFTAECTVFATYTLTPGDGIMIQADIPDAAPNLRLSYRSGDQIISNFVSQSGKDGSILLLEN